MNAAPAAPEEHHRILILDDEEIVLAALRDTLRREQYEVVALADPFEALETIKRQSFAVILTDQQMPLLTGLEFLGEVKQIQPNATRILITAVLNLGTTIDAINKGEIYRFLVKPWLREELLVTLKNAVARYELICANEALHAQTLAMNQELSAQIARVSQQNQRLDKLNHTLQQNLQHSIELSARMVEAFNPILSSHALRAAQVCVSMASKLDLTDAERETLEIGARLHNIGLVSIPRQLIRKWLQAPEALTEAEMTVIAHYPIIGQQLAAFVSPLEHVGTIIRSHRERLDGLGFPDRIGHDQIPWLSRLLAVAVAYATHPQPDLAGESIKAQSGSAFDPDAVRAFMRSLEGIIPPRGQQEVLLTELRPGMMLAKSIYTSNGMLLMPAGQVLKEALIEKLVNHNTINPITQTLLVYC